MTPTAATEPDRPSRASAPLLRIMLAALTAILAVNLYTGAPLLAIWAGSRVQNGTQLTMGTVGVVIGVLVVSVSILVFLLVRVEAAYKSLTDQPTKRRVSPWLRSMRAEREEYERRPLSGFEKALVISVVVAVAAFEVWFFFFSGSPIG
ncbi:MAG TPA: hypothetical protein VGJ32_08360 [Solirubrobacteraceae bacterium]|jgi:hypothetical protein